MNKNDLIGLIAEKNKLSKKEAKTFLENFLQIITNSLVKGENVDILGFGSFRTSLKKEHKGWNPILQKPMTIPECKYPHFKPGITLKNAVRNG